jgi:hypothetical protein
MAHAVTGAEEGAYGVPHTGYENGIGGGIDSRVDYLEQVVWKQNGGESTPLVIKHDRLEGRMKTVEQDNRTRNRQFTAILLLLIAAMAAATCDAIVRSQHPTVQTQTTQHSDLY